jgi:hypothetical protein
MSPAWRSAAKLLTKAKARRIAGEYRQAAGVVASKLLTRPVPMSAFGGKADIETRI